MKDAKDTIDHLIEQTIISEGRSVYGLEGEDRTTEVEEKCEKEKSHLFESRDGCVGYLLEISSAVEVLLEVGKLISWAN